MSETARLWHTIDASETIADASDPVSVRLADRVAAALAEVDDPEMPGISIVDLGLVEHVSVNDAGEVTVGLIPTFTGCPALAMIRDDVERAVSEVRGISRVEVRFLDSPAWSVERVNDRARARLGAELGVAVQVGSSPVQCPRCAGTTEAVSMFGPTRCRSVARCRTCGEMVEVMRS